MSGITLTASVRQNLLSLQDTASLLSSTQAKLATGKKVNSALDNPTNFFTSQGLNNRATDLNGLLDSIGQGQKTLEAADKGLTSLTTLVQSAKSIAKQARAAANTAATTFGQVTSSTTAQAEVLGAVTGTGTTGAGAGGAGNLVITAGGTDYTIAVANNDTAATIRDAINNTTGLGSTGAVTASIDGSNHLVLTASNADVDFSVNASSTDATTTALGITEGTAHNSTSLLDRIVAAGGSNGGSTLAIGVNGGATSTITFGTGAGQVSTFAELNTALGNISGLTGSVSGTTALLSVASSSTQNSLSLTGSTGISTALGISNGTLNGTAVTTSNTDATRASLQTQYNDILTQIDQLASDSSYNGINLLKGDNLKVTFNEKGTSSLTISGVTFDSAGLGLTAASGNAFQSNATVDATLSTIDTSLTTLRTQASKFGSNLTTVQTRNDFTKNLVNTLQSGSDALTLADSNEEAANVLALQTRQSLSISALSLANQSNQSVLQLLR